MKHLVLIAAFAVCSIAVFGQSDVDNLAKARRALVSDKNCDDALKYLQLVSPDYRQTTDYLQSMAMVQDCKKNNEQALYYYRKVLEQQPANDSVKKRVAELSDMQSHRAGASTESYVSAKSGNNNKHHKKKMKLDLYDNFCTTGLGYGFGLGGNNAPYKGEISINATNDFLLAHEQLVLDIDESLAFLTNPNVTWFNDALQAGSYSASPPGTGLAERLTMGLSPVLVNTKNLAVTAGAFGGMNFIGFPSGTDNYTANTINDQFTLCYGLKASLYLGQSLTIQMKLLLNANNTADVQTTFSGYTVPANYNTLSIGINYRFEPFWWWW